MIIVKLIGGLGNQMFQYAVGRCLADTYECNLKLDLTEFEHYSLRRYELHNYNIRASIASSKDIAYFRGSKVLHPFIDRARKFFRLLPPSVFLEKGFSFDSSVLALPPPSYLEGYWQSEKYFSKIRSALLDDFSLNISSNSDNQSILNDILTCKAVSLHVRRGDYVTNPVTAQFHGTCSLEYYRNAISFIGREIEHPKFFIFSDDIEWAIQNLKIDYPLQIVDINNSNQGIFDMELMKSCKHHIIANSSFSWWGAWLNPSNDKIIIAPKQWFNEAKYDSVDLIPQTWNRL